MKASLPAGRASVRAAASVTTVLAALFVLSLPAVTTRLYASDEIQYFAYLRSLWFDRDLSFENEYRYFYERGVAQGARPRESGVGYYGDGFHQTFLEARTATGLRINYAPIGSALLWSPFYAVADAGVRTARIAGADVRADGLSWPYIAATTYASAVYGFLALVLSIVAVRRLFGAPGWTVAAVWMGTPLLFYMYVAPGFSHATSAFAVAAFVVAWLHVRTEWSWRGMAGLGALAAVMAMVREQDVFIALGPAVDYAVTTARWARAGVRPLSAALARAAAGVAAFAACFLPQAASYLALYGRFGPAPDVGGKMNWLSPHALQVLLSPGHGFLFWTPLAILALAGLVAMSLGRVPAMLPNRPTDERADPWIGRMCLLMVASQIYVSGSVSTWMGGAFGQRRLIGLTVFLAIGLAALFRVVRPTVSRQALAAAVVLCVWWNLGLTAQFGANLMNRQRLELGLNAYHTFVTIPVALPQLAYRYLFDRESFYLRR